MPYVFQEEIKKSCPYRTGCEKLDSLYRLYDIFKDPSYFLINLFFDFQEEVSEVDIIKFLRSIIQNYQIAHLVVRCEQKSEIHPVPAIAFADVKTEKHLKACSEYIYKRLKQSYNCIVHEVITGRYPSNRLDWLYSFGIWYENFMPKIEIYPATDASSIKWGKLLPLDIISMDNHMDVVHTKIRDEKIIKKYQDIKINEWVEQFKTEMDEELVDKKLFTNVQDLRNHLEQNKHPLFNFEQMDLYIKQTKDKLIDIALKYASYARKENIVPHQTVIHGSLLYNQRVIIWDISTDKRWQHFQKR